MKILRCLIALSFCLGLTCVSHAAAIDFKMDVLDPKYQPGLTQIDASNTFSVTFQPCANFITHDSSLSSLAGDLCYEGINATEKNYLNDEDIVPDNDGGVTWNSLSLTFTNPSLGGCGILTAPAGTSSIFASAMCTENMTTHAYDLVFGGGGLIVQGEVFLIAEAGDTNPADFSGAMATVTSTPEPNSIVLLSTGVMMLGMTLYCERRRLQRNTVRS